MRPTGIVVGYDGSAHSRAALRYAVVQARLRKASLRIVTAFDYDWRRSRFTPLESVDQIERTVLSRFDELVDAAVEEFGARSPDVAISGEVHRGSPGPVLVDAGRDAALLVVGNRGHGGFGGLMLGSVGQYVATHAHGPVAVVRGSVDTADGPVVVGADNSRGSAARVLVDLSSTAGLVVVGSHGRDAITGTLLGSVSLQVLSHADCPVLIVRS